MGRWGERNEGMTGIRNLTWRREQGDRLIGGAFEVRSPFLAFQPSS
jgi:hypothetical protein